MIEMAEAGERLVRIAPIRDEAASWSLLCWDSSDVKSFDGKKELMLNSGCATRGQRGLGAAARGGGEPRRRRRSPMVTVGNDR